MTKTDNLKTSIYFQSPIFHIEVPEFVKDVNKVCDGYIKNAKKNN